MGRIYPRHRLDLSGGHLVRALAYCVTARSTTWGGDPVCCVSLRSGFDLLLEALELARGDEIVLSAVTHPDMARIIERRGLVPLPVDIEEDTLAPAPSAVEAAITPRTRAILVAHLFGGRVDLASIAPLAREHGVLLIEDCAQALRGPDDQGDEAADVSMFSFGAIKTCPALGGALMYVRDPDLLARMRALDALRPLQRRRDYAARAVRFLVLCALQNAAVYGAFVRLGAAVRLDTDRLVDGSVHALRPPSAEDGDAFGRWLRRRPSAPLLALLRHRLATFDKQRLARRAERGEALAAVAGPAHPGRTALDRTHWVFPVVFDDPQLLIRRLRSAGFDATAATTSIAAVGSPPPPGAAELMRRVVFVPAYPEMPEHAFERLQGVLQETL